MHYSNQFGALIRVIKVLRTEGKMTLVLLAPYGFEETEEE